MIKLSKSNHVIVGDKSIPLHLSLFNQT